MGVGLSIAVEAWLLLVEGRSDEGMSRKRCG